MFCPKCSAEYRSGFTHCSDCHVALIDSPPAPAPEGSRRADDELPCRLASNLGDYAEILILNNPNRIAVLKSVLESEGIEHFLQGEHYGTEFMLNDVRLIVPKKDESRVQRILSNTFDLGR